MILAFCIRGGEGSLLLDDRFGRADRFCILDSATGNHLKLLDNSMKELNASAGIGTVQSLFEEGVEGIVAPKLGPKAEDARKKLKINLWDQGDCKTVDEALASWRGGKLEELSGKQQPRGLYRA